EEAGAARVDLDRSDVALEKRRLVPGRRTGVEHALARPGADGLGGYARCAAPAAVVLERRRLALRPLARGRLLLPQVAHPDVVDPVRIGVLERPLREGRQEVVEPFGEAAADGVREARRALEVGGTDELDRVVGNGVRRRLAPAELIAGDAERGEDGRV